MELVKRLNEEFGMTIIMVLHDINQAAQYSDRLLVLKRGKLQYDGIPEEVLCHEMFQHVFGIDVDIFQGSDKPFFTPKRISKKRRSKMRTEERITTELVREFVMAAHGDLEKVQELLAESPSLLHASYNWGGSDWESALGAAAHVGRKDIALYLLEKGCSNGYFRGRYAWRIRSCTSYFSSTTRSITCIWPSWYFSSSTCTNGWRKKHSVYLTT